MTTQDEFISTLRAEYLDEAAYLLERCEETLLCLENSTDRGAALADLFRALHTIKGSGAVAGFDCIVGLAHVMEDLLSLLRNYPKATTTELVSLLLQGLDVLKERVKACKLGRVEAWDVTELKERLIEAAEHLKDAKAVIVFDDGKAATQSNAEKSHPLESEPNAAFGFFDEEPAEPVVTEKVTSEQILIEKAATEPVVTEKAVLDTAPTKESPATTAKLGAASIKVDAQRIDAVLDMVGELVIVKSQLLTRIQEKRLDPELQSAVALLDTIVRDLQDRALSIRMTPLKPTFLKLQRLARDLSLRCGKKIEFVMSGEDTELDRTMVEELADPLMHMMRNAIDHGIESAEKRRAAGKNEIGTIRILARQVGGRVEIEMRDDGGGLPRDKIIAKALEKGLIDSPDLSDREAFHLIFKPGFSTADKISDVSGRGVGMDVVKTNIERLRGNVEVRSEAGQYTSFVLSLPLTAAISDGILMIVGGRPFLVPIDAVRDLAKPENPLESRGTGVGHDVVRLKGRMLPVVTLHQWVDNTLKPQSNGMLVVVESEGRQAALLVDEVIGQMQVVLKPMANELTRCPGVAGGAIMGDGRVALVLDVQGLLFAVNGAERAAA